MRLKMLPLLLLPLLSWMLVSVTPMPAAVDLADEERYVTVEVKSNDDFRQSAHASPRHHKRRLFSFKGEF